MRNAFAVINAVITLLIIEMLLLIDQVGGAGMNSVIFCILINDQ